MAKQSANLDKKSDYFAFERIYFRHRAMVFAWVRGRNGFGRQLGSKWRHRKVIAGGTICSIKIKQNHLKMNKCLNLFGCKRLDRFCGIVYRVQANDMISNCISLQLATYLQNHVCFLLSLFLIYHNLNFCFLLSIFLLFPNPISVFQIVQQGD